ncbi:hypothetical protein TRFO_06001 [Tritrichomonas foetus]|uniref:Uncharacterized protein n=1 Tax=Tritrichomonas foetus TaxID=1144522 RepID=A0A1J4K6Q9_9EUKA|nr:hypothetical protein TRFO_06001 [Tritrichomonas foetus]|eukprot:OHT05398.1 hypothetical protein TRFO_06001 [Tritrichomonas foetus]
MEEEKSQQNLDAMNTLAKEDTDPNLATMLMTLYNQPNESLTIQNFISAINSNPNEGNKEKERINSRLNGFNPKDNPAWREITQRFGNNIKQPELLSIATVLANNASLKLDRDAKRRKSVLIKWFEENWSAIQPFLDYVVLEDAQH